MTNAGPVAIDLVSYTLLGGPNAADFSIAGNCVFPLQSGQSCTVSYRFVPSASGPRTAFSSVTTNEQNHPTYMVQLAGVGVTGAPLLPLTFSSPGAQSSGNNVRLVFSGTPVGSATVAQTVTVTNPNAVTVDDLSIVTLGNDDGVFSFPANTCYGSVAANSSCSFSVVFTPQATGFRSAAIQLQTSASPQQIQIISMTGTDGDYAAAVAAEKAQLPTDINNATVFLGDSITYYWPIPNHNQGVPGDTTSQMLARFDTAVLGQGYQRLVLLGGINDVILLPQSTPEGIAATIGTMAARAKAAGIEPVLCTLLPLTANPGLAPKVVAVNSAIAQLAADNGYRLADYYTPIANHPEDIWDGIHPNENGYVEMQKALLTALAN